LPDRAGQDPNSLPSLGFGFSVDQIGEAFDLRKVKNAILQSATGEFAGFGQTETRLQGKRPQDRPNDSWTAMQVQFDDGLAGKACAFGEGQDEGFVQQLATPGKPPQSGGTRGWKLPAQRRGRSKGCGA
jgi:hypothetical protein